MIAPDGAHLPRPAPRDAQIALGRPGQDLALGIDDLGIDAGKRPRRRSRLERRRARQRRDQRAAGLGLPPGVDDRAAPLTDHLVIPAPRLRIDRLAHRPEQLQALARGGGHERIALAHQRAQRGRRGVEDLDLVTVDHLPDAAGVRPIGHAFEHQRRRAVGERAVDDVAVPGDPADVGRAPIDLAGPVIEHQFVRVARPQQIAAAGVEHALGLAGRSEV